MEYQYRLLQPNEDYKQATIEKSGVTVEFTLAEVEASQAHNNKAKREVEGNLQIRKAEMANIDHFHPTIKDMTGEELTAAWIYKEAKDYIQKAEPKIVEIDAAITENDKTISDVMAALGFTPAIDPITSVEPSNETLGNA